MGSNIGTYIVSQTVFAAFSPTHFFTDSVVFDAMPMLCVCNRSPRAIQTGCDTALRCTVHYAHMSRRGRTDTDRHPSMRITCGLC